jgi:predicted  nucleic acid-binding Zn-ribbon protein
MLIKSAQLIGWAIGGIEREIVETRARLAALTAQAGQLRSRIGKAGRPIAAAAEAVQEEVKAVRAGRQRRRRKMSPEARKRISDRMTKLWAERRKKG